MSEDMFKMTDEQRALLAGDIRVNPVTGRSYTPSSWKAVDLEEVKQGGLRVEPPMYLPRTDGKFLLYAGRSHSFWGASETLKSWAATLACKSVLEAGERAVYVDFEDEAVSFVERCRAVGIPEEAIGRELRYIRPEEDMRARRKDEDVMVETGRLDLDWEMTPRPALVVFDGTSEGMALHGFDPLSTADTVKYQHLFLRGMPDGVMTIEVDHTAKGKGNSGQFGAQQKKAGIDGASYQFRELELGGRGGHSAARVTVEKDRHGHVRSFARDGEIGVLHLDDTGEQPRVYLEAHDNTPAAEKVAGRIFAYLTDHPRASTRDIKAAVHGKDAHKDAALAQLTAEGIVTADAEGRGKATRYTVAPGLNWDGESELGW